MSLDMEDLTLDMVITQAKTAQLKNENNTEKLPALFDKTLDALVSACEKIEVLTAELDRLQNGVLGLRVAELTRERDAAKSDYTELQQRQDELQTMLFNERQKSQGLAAQVEQLRNEINGMAAVVFSCTKSLIEATDTLERELLPALEDKEPLEQLISELRASISTTPAQCLAERDAEVAAKAVSKFVSDTNETGQFSWSDCQWLEDWRDEWLEQQAKGGA